MSSIAFRCRLEPDKKDGGYVVTFPDLPFGVTQGETVAEALTEAADCLEGLQDAVNGDYAEQVKARDRSGPPYDQHGTAILLNEACQLLRAFETDSEVSVQRLRELLAPLAAQKAVYANVLMNERGTSTDSGLGLLRFAMGRLDEGSTLRAQEQLNAALHYGL